MKALSTSIALALALFASSVSYANVGVVSAGGIVKPSSSMKIAADDNSINSLLNDDMGLNFNALIYGREVEEVGFLKEIERDEITNRIFVDNHILTSDGVRDFSPSKNLELKAGPFLVGGESFQKDYLIK